MQTAQTQLFTPLSVEEAANVNGAYGYYPVYHCYPVSSWGGGHGGSWGGSSSSSVNQSVNVNVLIED